MIDGATIDKILQTANIVDVVSDFVTLKKSGANYKGLCPFHNEKTPSFMVSPSRGSWHCFGCGKGGTAVGFVMEHEQMSYPEALRWLANKYHIEIREHELTSEERARQTERESLFIINEWARDFFRKQLGTTDGKTYALPYFRSRGFRDDIIEKFSLGYSPPRYDALSGAAVSEGYDTEYLLKSGLCLRSGGDGAGGGSPLVDRFAGRVIFPWLNTAGKAVAFGGRLLDSRTKGVQQKYVNSPESPIYKKSNELYGIYWAKKEIAKEDRVFLVEGYTDVLSMHQCGIENVVANSGTALSLTQIHVLHRFTNNIVLLYDSDEAGLHAAMRGTDMLLQEGMNIKVLILPDGDDPDSFARKHTSEDFRRYVNGNQRDFITFKSEMMLHGVNDPIKRSEVISSIVKSISLIPDQITRATYISDCSHRFSVDERTLIYQMNRFIRGSKPSSAQAAPLVSPPSAAEENMSPAMLLLQCVMRFGERVIVPAAETADGETVSLNVAQYIDYSLYDDGITLGNALYDRILSEAVEHSAAKDFNASAYFLHHSDIDISRLACRLTTDRYTLPKSLEMTYDAPSLRRAVDHLLLLYRHSLACERVTEAKEKIKRCEDKALLPALLKEYKEAQTRRDEVSKKLGIVIT